MVILAPWRPRLDASNNAPRIPPWPLIRLALCWKSPRAWAMWLTEQHQSRLASELSRSSPRALALPYRVPPNPRVGYVVFEKVVSSFARILPRQITLDKNNTSCVRERYYHCSCIDTYFLRARGIFNLQKHGSLLRPRCSPRAFPCHLSTRWA